MARQLKTDGLSAMITKNRCEAVPSQVPVHACEFLPEIRPNYARKYVPSLDKGVSHCQAKVYMTYDDTN